MSDFPQPYASVLDHLADHLARLGNLFAAHVLRSPERAHREDRQEFIARIQRIAIVEPPVEAQEQLRAADEKLAQIRARERETEIDLPLVRLARTFALSQTEQDVLLLAAASSVDPRFAADWSEVDVDLTAPNVAVAISLFARSFREGVAMRRVFTTGAPLIAHSLVLLDSGRHEGNLLEHALSISRRVVSELLGHSDLDDELVAFSRVRRSQVSLDQVVVPEATKSLVLSVVQNHGEFLERRRDWGIDDVVTYGRAMVLLFAGQPGTGKTMLAHAIAHELKKRLFSVDLAKLLESGRTIESNLDAVFREAKLLDAVLFFDECEQLFVARRLGNGHMPALLTHLERFDGIAILATNMPQTLDDAMRRRVVASIEFRAPTAPEREQIWRRHLPDTVPLEDDVDLERLAEDFELTGGTIKNAVLTAVMRSTARKAATLSQEDLTHGARLQLHITADDDTEQDRVVRPEAHLDDVVLPPAVRRCVEDFIAAAKIRPTVLLHWGFGRTLGHPTSLAGLLSGPPGTGKSLTAEAIATALGRPLLRCTLAAVLSKYVGQTARNVEALFRRARAHRAVLVFDEADALFARRVEVRTANDRFANAESASLLAELDRHDGVVLLTTNLETALDSAFQRRLQLRVTFPLPDARGRAAIWAKLLPSEAPLAPNVDPVDLGRRYELSGGQIRNAVQAAAFEAAGLPESQRLVTHTMLDRAARRQAQPQALLTLSPNPEPERPS